MEKPKRPISLPALIAFPLFLVLIGIAIVTLWDDVFSLFFTSPEVIRSWVLERGTWAPVFFVALQILQVVVFVVPGEVVQVTGGFLFGLWQGTALSILGILLGSLVNFTIGRLLGRPFVEGVFGAERVRKLEAVAASGKAAAGFFLLFAIPGIPKDALCYVAGMSRLSFPMFTAISGLGRLPGILGSSYMGSAVFKGDYGSAIVVLIVASAFFLVGLLFKERITEGIGRLLGGEKNKNQAQK